MFQISYDTYMALLYGWLAIALIIFIILFWVTAPFGRHTTEQWGLSINNRLAWVLMELPSPLVFSLFFWTGAAALNSITLTLWLLWMLHYTNRSIVYPLRQRDTHKKMPVVIMFSAVFFNLMNGFFNGYYLGNWGDAYTHAWLMDIRFWLGLLLFIGGLAINWHSDHILLHLRKPGETHYSIPQGGLFRWLSCPNLFGEIIEWIGFALIVSHWSAWAFAIWTAANLVPRAWAHHRWYQSRFPDYPKERRAVIPFLF